MNKIDVKLKNPLPKNTSPWDLLQPVDESRFGKDVFDRKEQERWSRAIFVGGLPYMWRKAYVVLDMIIYALLELKEGDKVFLIGEALESCGFVDGLKARVGESGTSPRSTSRKTVARLSSATSGVSAASAGPSATTTPRIFPTKPMTS